jgi:hypothetical protein
MEMVNGRVRQYREPHFAVALQTARRSRKAAAIRAKERNVQVVE